MAVEAIPVIVNSPKSSQQLWKVKVPHNAHLGFHHMLNRTQWVVRFCIHLRSVTQFRLPNPFDGWGGVCQNS